MFETSPASWVQVRRKRASRASEKTRHGQEGRRVSLVAARALPITFPRLPVGHAAVALEWRRIRSFRAHKHKAPSITVQRTVRSHHSVEPAFASARSRRPARRQDKYLHTCTERNQHGTGVERTEMKGDEVRPSASNMRRVASLHYDLAASASRRS